MKKLAIPSWIVYIQKEEGIEYILCDTRNEAREKKEVFSEFGDSNPKIKKCKIIIE